MNARPRPDAASAPATAPAAVLQADSTTQSASSFKARISSIVSSPSPSVSATAGAVKARAGCERPSSSPGTNPCVANATILNLERFIVLTLFSLASLPRLRTLLGSACSASAIDFNSSAVSGSRGNCASCIYAIGFRAAASLKGQTAGNVGRPRTLEWFVVIICGIVPGRFLGLLLAEQRIAKSD